MQAAPPPAAEKAQEVEHNFIAGLVPGDCVCVQCVCVFVATCGIGRYGDADVA